jgi:hypothetical protein
MTLGSKENYINVAATKHEVSFHRHRPEERGRELLGSDAEM